MQIFDGSLKKAYEPEIRLPVTPDTGVISDFHSQNKFTAISLQTLLRR
jgi:hypothetical protein